MGFSEHEFQQSSIFYGSISASTTFPATIFKSTANSSRYVSTTTPKYECWWRSCSVNFFKKAFRLFTILELETILEYIISFICVFNKCIKKHFLSFFCQYPLFLLFNLFLPLTVFLKTLLLKLEIFN